MMKSKSVFLSLWGVIFFIFSCAPGLMPASGIKETTAPALTSPSDMSSWEVEWSNIQAAARKERSVAVYATGTAFQARAMQIKVMKEKYGIELEMTSGRGEEIAQRFLTQRRAGIYTTDIYIGGATTILTQIKPAGLLEPLEPMFLLPEVRDSGAWVEGRFLDKDKLVFAFIAYPNVPMTVNSDLVKEGDVKSFKDLLNPKWKGKIVIDDPTVNGSGLKQFQFVGSIIMNIDYWRELAKLEPAISRDKRLPVEWLTRGKYSIGMALTPGTVLEFQKAGAPLKTVSAEEGAYVTSGSGCVVYINKAPHPNAAKVFLNWLLSREGGLIYSEATGTQSARLDVPTSHLDANETRKEGVKYWVSDREEFILQQPESAKIALDIFGHLMR